MWLDHWPCIGYSVQISIHVLGCFCCPKRQITLYKANKRSSFNLPYESSLPKTFLLKYVQGREKRFANF